MQRRAKYLGKVAANVKWLAMQWRGRPFKAASPLVQEMGIAYLGHWLLAFDSELDALRFAFGTQVRCRTCHPCCATLVTRSSSSMRGVLARHRQCLQQVANAGHGQMRQAQHCTRDSRHSALD